MRAWIWIMCGCLLGLAWGGFPRALAAVSPAPPLCARGGSLQRAVLAALDAAGSGALDCATVTNPQLAALRALGQTQPVVITRAADLAGLAGLEALHLRFEGVAWPPDFLALTPRLRTLTLDTSRMADLPPDLLAPIPHLTQLTVEAHSISDLPPDFLAPVPHLAQLTVEGPVSLPPDFLAPVPHLAQLTVPCLPAVDFLQPTPRLAQLALLCLPNPAAFVHVPQLVHLDLSLDWVPAALPPGFLTHVPRLTRLSLRRAGLAALPPDLLAPVPQLTHFELHGAGGPDGLTTLPPGLLAPVPRLTHLALRLELPPPRPPARQPTLLPPDFLSPVPQLTHLSLECAPPLPSDFLASVPRLTHLTLCFGYQNREPLAVDFLTPVPRLTHLTLEAFFALPPAFLAPVPRLTHLIEAVPPFPYALQYVPRLTHLEMRWTGQPLASLPYLIQAKLRVPSALSLPSDFLRTTGAPRRTGTPPVPSAFPLPSDFLAYAPRLERLEVYAPRVQALPRDFLAHAPRLERLEVYAPRVQALPPRFLAYAPRLIHLNLHDVQIPYHLGVAPDGIVGIAPGPWAPALTTVPDDFLAYAPRLTYLNLPVRRLAQVPPQVQDHLRAHGTLAVVDVPWGHVHFPTGDPGLCARPALRYPIVDGERDVWFASPVRVAFACPEAPAWQPAPQTLCCPPAPLGVNVAPVGNAVASGLAAGVAWVDGLVVALHAQPNRRSAVTGHACRGDVVRIEARHGDGAWLRVRLVDQFFFPDEIRYKGSGRYTRIYWIPATAVRPWLPEDPIPAGCPFRG